MHKSPSLVLNSIDTLLKKTRHDEHSRWQAAADYQAGRSKVNVTWSELRATVAAIGKLMKSGKIEPRLVLVFADFLGRYVADHAAAIDVYIAIIEHDPFTAEAYRKLIDLHHYDLDRLSRFDFLGNLRSNRKEAADPIFPCMSYTYTGKILERLGRLNEAARAYGCAAKFADDPRGIANAAQYAAAELDFVADACQFTVGSWQAGTAREGKAPLLLSTVFFGSSYRRLFETCAGASFFTPATLAALKSRWDPLLLIFCRPTDRLPFLWSPLYQRVSRLIPVHFIEIPPGLIDAFPDPAPPGARYHPAMPYSVSGLAQVCAAEIARRHNAALISIPPDAAFADSAGGVIATHVDKGAQIVFTCGIRLVRESVEAALASHWGEKPGLIQISVPELSSLALRHLHPATRACVVNGKPLTYPGMLWWRVRQAGLVGHCFQMHPIYISGAALRRSTMRRFDSIDGDFVGALLPNEEDWKDISVITASQECAMFELTGRSMEVPRLFDPAALPGPTAAWVRQVMRPLNFWLFNHQVRVGATEPVNSQVSEQIASVIAGYKALAPTHAAVPAIKVQKQTAASADVTAMIRSRQRRRPADGNGPIVAKRSAMDPDDMRVVYSLAVWGEGYSDNFLSASLPTLLSNGNLWNLQSLRRSLFVVHTDADGQRMLEHSPTFQALRRRVRVACLSP